MRVLVTGGAGFIGSHLVERLLRLGHEVVVLDDLTTGHTRFLETVLHHPNHTFVQGSVIDRALIRQAIASCDVVYHLAAVLGVKNTVDDPLKVIAANLDGTRVVVEEAFAKGIKVVFASTSEVYGKSQALPFHEDADRVLGSTTVNRWCYATAKAMDEHLCLAYAGKGLSVVILRYFNAYGPRAVATAYGGVVPRFIRAALSGAPLTVYGTGLQKRCFTYISDIVDGTIAAAAPAANHKIINLGSQDEISVGMLAEKIVELAKSKSEIQRVPYSEAYGPGYEDMMRRVPNLERANTALGYKPKIDLNHGLQNTIQWFRETALDGLR